MSKRTLPLLYIHQPKEVETEADNQEFFYTRKIVVNQKKEKAKKDMELISEEEGNETDSKNDLEEGVFQYTSDEDEIMEKLTYVQSMPLGIEPEIELELDDEKYIGVLEKIEEETVVLRTRTAPYQIECPLDQISSVKIISL